MTIIYKFFKHLQFWNLRISHPTYTEIHALWLVEKWQQRLISENGRLGRLILQIFEVISKKISLHISILVCKSVPESYLRKLEQKYNFEIVSLKAPYSRETSISYMPQPIVVPNPQMGCIWNSIVITRWNNNLLY